MKKFKILLGASALFLSIAGIAATRANVRQVTDYYQQTASVCTPISVPCDGGTFTCKTVIGGKTFTVFQNINPAHTLCNTPLTKSTN